MERPARLVSLLRARSNLLIAFSVSAFQRFRRALASSLFALRSMFQLFSVSEVFGVCFSSSLSVERWTLRPYVFALLPLLSTLRSEERRVGRDDLFWSYLSASCN